VQASLASKFESNAIALLTAITAPLHRTLARRTVQRWPGQLVAGRALMYSQ